MFQMTQTQVSSIFQITMNCLVLFGIEEPAWLPNLPYQFTYMTATVRSYEWFDPMA